MSHAEKAEKAAHIIDPEAFRMDPERRTPRQRLELIRRRMIAQSKATRILALATIEETDAQEA